MENRDLYVVTEYEGSPAPDVPPGAEPSQSAQDRLDLMVRLLALGGRYVGGADGTFDEDEHAEAVSPHVLVANLEELLHAGNPDEAASIQRVIDSVSEDEIKNRLADALDSVEQSSLSREQMLEEIEELGDRAEGLNGFLPLDIQIHDDASRDPIADVVDRFDLEVDMSLLERDKNAFEDAFYDAKLKTIGHRFHVLSGYLVILHGMSVGKLAHPDESFSDEQEAAVEEVGTTYGLKLGDWWAGKKVASRRVKKLKETRFSNSVMRRFVDKVFDRITVLFEG
ncbi:hypothetical protein [Salinibacter altiplanensis]|uniref:hypothetical protein n=1 Tax=Salinibacter altiplanensis TaxID=1803181 RepID=UPI00131A450C|nr:hypothetical protein [Salinibacter altiplanensis]